MILSSFAFSLMGVFIKLTGDIPTTQKTLIRTVVIMIVSFIVMKSNSVKIGKIKKKKWVLIRCVAGTAGILLNFYSLDKLILSDAAIILRVSTVMTLIFSFLFLGEKISKLQLSMIILAFFGVLLVIKPEFKSDTLYYIYALLGACSAALAYTALRAIGNSMDSSVIVFLFATFTFFAVFPFVIFNFRTMSLYQITMNLLASLAATVGQFSISIAYKYAPAREISIYNYSGIIFSGVLGYFFFNDYPDVLSFIGYVTIFLSSLVIYLNKSESSFLKKKKPTSRHFSEKTQNNP